MKFLLDQNVERRLATFLRNLHHDVKIVSIDFPPGISDREVLTFAYRERRILLTNDKGDFGELIPTTPLPLALCLSALTMREICLVIASLNPGHEGEALLNRICMQG